MGMGGTYLCSQGRNGKTRAWGLLLSRNSVGKIVLLTSLSRYLPGRNTPYFHARKAMWPHLTSSGREVTLSKCPGERTRVLADSSTNSHTPPEDMIPGPQEFWDGRKHHGWLPGGGSCSVVQAGLELLPQPLECWDYRCVPPPQHQIPSYEDTSQTEGNLALVTAEGLRVERGTSSCDEIAPDLKQRVPPRWDLVSEGSSPPLLQRNSN
ncbi:PREDICTED: uncharacterized protein LOC106149240 [Chinchilla lanigera]|uniref:uncharacterized protein LOC106149240 n=1 Tax=Chinchilla lanigera TaxID=34839 RepID=UPI000695B7AD|nr:PREDICTED: uncharacterized protein LOC106149240 [Chinchilla lanigera]